MAPSTPVQDFRLHVLAWQHHFASIFGVQALERVKGFSPSEMALPNHPDVAYEFVKTLKACGFTWLLVQEHTVEQPNGGGVDPKHIPHRLVCTNSHGESESIVILIKTQGSDTKLVGQMQPWYEARGMNRWSLNGRSIPPLVMQISDGENGGVMMNDFPPKYAEVVHAASWSDVPLMNGSEYLEHLFAQGFSQNDFPVAQPLFQKRIWDRMKPGDGPARLKDAITDAKKEDCRFHMEGGSWTNNISWVCGYEHVLGPLEQVSRMFSEKVLNKGVHALDPRYRNALFHLLTTQTSCFRYWGDGVWTDYAKELCRRTSDILKCDF